MANSWKRICPLCNKEFISYALARKFCSDECFKEHRRIYCGKNHRRYYAEGRFKRDPKKTKIHNHNFYINHKKECSERNKKWALENREKKLAWDRKYYQDHKEQNRINCKEYSKNHREQLNKYLRNWKRNHPMSVFIDRLRKRVWDAVKGNIKSASTKELLGCTTEFLRNYLQSQFTEGMTWDNYGEWHIDHIKPCASFDLSKPEEQNKCFHYTNLQPLWAIDNMKKGAKL
jgi:hypothetical protein